MGGKRQTGRQMRNTKVRIISRTIPPSLFHPSGPLTQKKLKQSTWAISMNIIMSAHNEKIMTVDNILHSNSAKITIFMNHERMHRNRVHRSKFMLGTSAEHLLCVGHQRSYQHSISPTSQTRKLRLGAVTGLA